jgi:6-phosphogluconolactonase
VLKHLTQAPRTLCLLLALSGCGGASSPVDPSPVSPKQARFLLTASPVTQTVIVYTITPGTGTLTRRSGRVVPLGSYSVVVHPNGRYVYADSAHAIYQFAFSEAAGTLTPLSPSFEHSGLNHSVYRMTIDPSGRFLYATHPSGARVSGHRIDPATGALSPLPGPPVATGRTPGDIACDPHGRYLYVSNWGEGSLSGYRVGADGGLTPIAGFPLPSPKPFGLNVDPSGRFLYVAFGDASRIGGYAIGPQGDLTALRGSPFVVGEQPSHVEVSPDGRTLYVSDPLAKVIHVRSLDPATGRPTVPPGASRLVSDGFVIRPRVDPTGQFLYAATGNPSGLWAYNALSGGEGGIPLPNSPISAEQGITEIALIR